jgi:hypothetical protein
VFCAHNLRVIIAAFGLLALAANTRILRQMRRVAFGQIADFPSKFAPQFLCQVSLLLVAASTCPYQL